MRPRRTRRQPSRHEDFDEAITYVTKVHKVFKEEEEKYRLFLQILGNYKAKRISVDVVKTQMRELFADRQDLITGFNAFLPQECEMITTDDIVANRRRRTELLGLRSFLNKLKERFQDDDHIYNSFMGILDVYMIVHKDITKVQHEVGALLEGHPDLVEQFTRISSDNAASTSTTKTLTAKSADLELFASVLSAFDEGRIK